MRERRLTKEERDEIRNVYGLSDEVVLSLLDDLDAADAEIARLRKALEDVANHEEGIGPECDFGSGNMGCYECGEKRNIAANELKD